jgi:peptidoglycan/xylan/chitin deacetylase (PgdA/CDA1 family)
MKTIMYHYIKNDERYYKNFRYLNLKNFIKQLDYFEKKYGICNYEEIINFHKNPKSKKIILTFDDGLQEHYNHVYKILKRREKSAIFFIPSKILNKNTFLKVHKIHFLIAKIKIDKLLDQLNNLLKKNRSKNLQNYSNFNKSYTSNDDHQKVNLFKRYLNYYIDHNSSEKIVSKLIRINKINLENKNFYLNKKNLLTMSNNKMVIGSHSHSHPVLSNLNYKNQKHEIFLSSKVLQQVTGKKMNFFSFPYGIKNTYNQFTLRLLTKIGVKHSFIADNHISSDKKFNHLKLKRFDCNKFIYGKSN